MVTQAFDPFLTSVRDEDPYPIYRHLRDELPFYRDDTWDLWVMSRFDDVQNALRDHATYSSEPDIDIDGWAEMLDADGNILVLDPPRHDQLRKLLNGTNIFTPRAISEMELQITKIVDDLLDRFADSGSADLVEDFTYPLPLQVGPVLIGFPPEDLPVIDAWQRQTQVKVVGQKGIPPEAIEASAKIRDYIEDLVADRRRRPREDVVSKIAASAVDGVELTTEAVGLTFLLLEASIDTTAGLLENGLLALSHHPQQRRRLVNDRSLMVNAVEEMLRYDTPVQFNARNLTRDVELHSVVAPEGARVVLLFGSANRDERQFADPDTFDVSRRIRRHLGFGEGIHFCIGAPLARMEAKVAIDRFLTRIPDFEVSGPTERIMKQNLRGFLHLPIGF